MTDVLARLVLPVPPRVDRYSALRPIERVAILPVRNYGPPPIPDPFPVRHRFAQVWLPKCKAGDHIKAEFDMQASNRLAYQVELAWSLRLTQSATGFEGLMIAGTSNASNITPQMHHMAVEEAGEITIPSDGDWWLIAMVYAGGGSQSQPGDQIYVDQGYGAFNATRIRSAL